MTVVRVRIERSTRVASVLARETLIIISSRGEVNGLHAGVNLVSTSTLVSAVENPDDNNTTNGSTNTNEDGDSNGTILGGVLTLSRSCRESSFGASGSDSRNVPYDACRGGSSYGGLSR